MPRQPRRRGRRFGLLLLLILVAYGGWWIIGALSRGPEPSVQVTSDRRGVGAATKITAVFKEPTRGLGTVRLEVVQGDKTAVLAEKTFPRQRGWFGGGAKTPEATLEATIGRASPAWLKEGEVVVRATAERAAGALRSAPPTLQELKLPVRLRPPRLELMTHQHYVRQGGAGVVVTRVGETVARSGVRSGKREFVSFPLPGGAAGERMTLFGIPWDMADRGQVKIFAEDDAGNRVEQSFVDIFKLSPPRRDTIQVTDAFLEQAVPSIASQTPGFDATGTQVEQYVRINRDLRRENLAEIAKLSEKSEPAFLWSGAFLQMKNTARKAGYAEVRSYVYNGRPIDQETHLGLDLAENAHGPAPAANAGKVIFAGFFGIYGNAVIIDHGYGVVSLNGHLSEISVKEGQAVEKGQIVGRTGSTGLAGGDHLHLEIFVQGTSVDPVEWLDEHWIKDNLATKVKLPGF